MTLEATTRGNAGGRPVVDTTYGPVRGVDDGTVKSWKAIRYAAAPVGDLRWRAPQPPQRWSEPFDADRVGPVCPQPTDPRIPIDLGAPQGEDFLSLNVWAPADARPGAAKPVMVWVHGGAYILGSASQPLYHGRRLAADGGVIVVTVNYRLGALGFLELPTLGADSERFATNVGLRDVLAALEWVRDNIAGFGGDPARVTLFGESAGAGMVTTLLGSPAARGLFSAAIAQSSPVTSSYDAEPASRTAARFLDVLGVGHNELTRLAGMPIEAIVEASRTVFDEVPVRTPGRLAFAPIVDGDLVPDYPVRLARAGKTLPVPLIIGTNRNEAALFRYMKSPLMPISPDTIRAMFAEIAAEQPDLALPGPDDLDGTYRGRARPGDWGWPAIWASGCRRSGSPTATAPPHRCSCTASISPPRCCDCCACTPHTPPSSRSSGETWARCGGTRCSPWAGARTARRSPDGSGPAGRTSPPTAPRRAPAGNRRGGPTAPTTAPPWSSTNRTAWSTTSTRRCGARGATTCSSYR